MKFRPCIDIHNGQVKQIVGSSLKDEGDQAKENFASAFGASYYAKMYRAQNLPGGHVILLNAKDSPHYEATKQQAIEALQAYPGGLQLGGGIGPANADIFLDAGADKVIVTSYVFAGGQLHMDKLDEMVRSVGKEHLTLDLSCRKVDGQYRIVTDRWQKVSDFVITKENVEMLSAYAAEFLVHAVDVEGKNSGVEEELLSLLGAWCKIPVTYAGGVHAYDDLAKVFRAGAGAIDVTVGSALSIFGGALSMEEIARQVDELNRTVPSLL